MKIESKKLKNFLEYVQMKEDVPEAVLEFNEDGLRINAIDGGKTKYVNGLLHKDVFKEYEAIGNAGLGDLKSFVNVLKRLGKELEFNIEGNLLTAKGGKKSLQYEMKDEKFITKSSTPTLEHYTTVTMPAATLKEFIDDAKMNNDATLCFETVDGGLKMYNTGKYKFTHTVDSENTKGSVFVKFGQPLVRALDNIKDGEVTLHLASNYPIIVEYKNDDDGSHINFIVAPYVDSSAQSTEEQSSGNEGGNNE